MLILRAVFSGHSLHCHSKPQNSGTVHDTFKKSFSINDLLKENDNVKYLHVVRSIPQYRIFFHQSLSNKWYRLVYMDQSAVTASKGLKLDISITNTLSINSASRITDQYFISSIESISSELL